MLFSRVYTVDTMRRECKSRKMLFFIISLLFIIQAVSIIGLAGEAKDDKTVDTPKDVESIFDKSTSLTSYIERMITDILGKELVKEENTATNEKELKITGDPTTKTEEDIKNSETGTDINNDKEKEEITSEDNTETSASTPTTNLPDTDSSSDPTTTSNMKDPSTTSDDTNTKEEENPPELEPELNNKEKYNFAIATPNPQLTIDAPNYVSPGDELKIVVTSDAKPVGGATVKFLSEITTDEDGTASIKIPISLADMKLILTATKDDFDPCTMWINIGSKEKTEYTAQHSNVISALQRFQNTWNLPFLDRLIAFQTGN